MTETISRHPADLAATLAIIYLVWIACERLARGPRWFRGLGASVAGIAAAFMLYAIWGR